jgi:hypothetical protein
MDRGDHQLVADTAKRGRDPKCAIREVDMLPAQRWKYEREPKSPRSRRTIPLSTAVVTLPKAQRAAQAAERLHAGNQWTGLSQPFSRRTTW